MDVSATNPNNHDIFKFKDANKEKYINLIEQEILKLRSVKVSFGLKVNFEIEREGQTQEMSHYFKEDQPHVFTMFNREEIEQKYEEFMERIRGEIENWSMQGSGWEIESIELAYINVAKYEPLRGGSYLKLPNSAGKQKSNSKREKQRQRMSEVGIESSTISTQRRCAPRKTKKI